jgi:hypothetical protein
MLLLSGIPNFWIDTDHDRKGAVEQVADDRGGEFANVLVAV